MSGARFIIAVYSNGMKPYIVWESYTFAHLNEANIRKWMEKTVPTAKWTGMVIEFDTEQDLMLFKLRWE